jgi:hypothetical protein
MPKYSIPQTMVSQEIGEEVVILNLSNERYYSLDEVGASFWNLLVEGQEFDQIVQTMLAEFEVDEETLRNDLAALLNDLEAAGILVVES